MWFSSISELTGAIRKRRTRPWSVARPYSRDMPLPPSVCMAASSALYATSEAVSFAIAASTPPGSPRSNARAADAVSSRDAASAISALASGWDMAWCAPIGTFHTVAFSA